jgi:hypothetical protein
MSNANMNRAALTSLVGVLASVAALACAGSSGTSTGAPHSPAPELEPPPAAAPTRAAIKTNGEVVIYRDGKEIAQLAPGLFDKSWQGRRLSIKFDPPRDINALPATLTAPDGTEIDTLLRWSKTSGGVRLTYVFTPKRDVELNSLHVEMSLPMDSVEGRPYRLDGVSSVVPGTLADEIHLADKPVESLELDLADGKGLTLRFARSTRVLVQDNRRWSPTLQLRLGTQEPRWLAGKPVEISFELTAEGGLDVQPELPVTIAAGRDWVPLVAELDIAAGSALDFSSLRPTAAPAGVQGRIVATPKGTFAFEKVPESSVRFYGINLCFSAHYISHEQADVLAARLARAGYNTLRIHHHEGQLAGESSGLDVMARGDKPASTGSLSSFEAPTNADDHYSARVSGYLHPPTTGDYTFYIASDDDGELFLSTDESPANKRRIARVQGYTSPRQWDKYGSQKSSPIRLEAGKRYYIEAVHDEGTGGDHLAVAYSGPGFELTVIPGKQLSESAAGKRGSVLREVWKRQARSETVTLNPRALDQLDYLVAALKKQGIYVTTDLFVSRPVLASEVYPGSTGRIGMNDFKMAVLVNERAFQNWKAFSKNLLTHKNPYTGLRWADDPVLGWLSMVNEGNAGNFIGSMDERVKRDFQAKWNEWLKRNYGTEKALRKAWGDDPGGDPAKGSVPLPGNIHDRKNARSRDLAAFCAEVERDAFARMRRFVVEEIGSKVLLTTQNGWTNRLANHTARASYDYVDDHFYIDHPEFIQRDWQLPSRSPNTSPVAGGATGGRPQAFIRLLGKPYTISEFNYSGPGRFRGVGGILTGALAATQDWGTLWRFAYSHSRDNLFEPRPAGYFDIVTDPLNQAAERAAIALFLRGDLASATRTIGVAMTTDELLKDRRENHDSVPPWHALAFVAKVGSFVAEKPGAVPADLVVPLGWSAPRTSWSGSRVLDADPFAKETGPRILETMRSLGWLEGNLTNLDSNVIQNETRQFMVDAPADTMTIDTPMTAGGYAPAGSSITTSSALIKIIETDGTVWVSSVDKSPITKSRRLVVTHLTDLQNTGARFAEPNRQILLDWGTLPHLVRVGTAEIALRLEAPAKYKVFALTGSGRRAAAVESRVEGDRLVIPLDVRGPEGARLAYEVALE